MQTFNIPVTSFENYERFCFSCNLKEHIGFHYMLYERMLSFKFQLNFNAMPMQYKRKCEVLFVYCTVARALQQRQKCSRCPNESVIYMFKI